jgi:uncharacterized protein (DUF58 family)
MEGDKLQLAKQVAGALSVIALGSQDRLSLAGVDENLHSYQPPGRGRQRVTPTLQTLEGLPCTGGTNWTQAITQVPRHRGSGVALLFTDGFDEQGLELSLRRLASRNNEVHLFHILTPEDIRPSLRGDLLLVDAESGQELPVSIDEHYINDYEKQVRSWAEDLQHRCRRLGIGYSLLSTETNIDDILFKDLRKTGILAQ